MNLYIHLFANEFILAMWFAIFYLDTMIPYNIHIFFYHTIICEGSILFFSLCFPFNLDTLAM
jgi:hypothetical protein